MEITKEFMMRVAANARIALTAEELEEFIPDFKEILDTFEKLKEVNTEKCSKGGCSKDLCESRENFI